MAYYKNYLNNNGFNKRSRTGKLPIDEWANIATKQNPSETAAIQQAVEELRNTGAAFVVFQLNNYWYELAYPFRKAVRICGARKKTGERCRCKALHRGGKCKFHGGLSTGAKTPEGKARAIAAMREGQARWIAGKTNRMQS